MSLTIQSTPSSNPSLVLALQGIIPQCLVVIMSNPKKSLIYAAVKLPGMSCLLQNISKVAPMSFYYLSKLCNYFLVSSSLSLSELSTTQITPSVCSK